MNIYLILTAILIFILLYFILTLYFKHKRFNYLQETAIAIIIGIIVGLFVNSLTDFFQDNSQIAQSYIRDVIIIVLLPPIMFQDGYNFPKRKFFQNFQLINLFGLLGTALNFFIIWGLLYAFNNANLFVSVSDAKESIYLQNWHLLLTAAALSSIEPVVTEKVIDKENNPKLFSIIFGESLYKDTIAITIFDSISEIVSNSNASQDFDVGGQDIGFIILKFVEVCSCSILIGVAIGILVTIVFKNMRFLIKEAGISEVALTIIAGYLCYLLSQWASLSGVISMLFCGTVLSHYNSYNLTEIGKESTLIIIQVLKIASCGVIFLFIGFEIFSVQSFESAIDHTSKLSFSVSFLGLTFLALLIGRIVNIFLMSLLGWLITKSGKWRLNIYESWIIFFSGLVHGAVPFALIVSLDVTNPQSNCTQLNIIAVVLITSLFLNALIPKLLKIMLSKIKQLSIRDPNHPSLKDSFRVPVTIQEDVVKNMVKQSGNEELLANAKSSPQRYWNKFDEGILKPFLIYDYYQRKNQIKMQKLKKRMEEHQKFLNRFSYPQNILSLENEETNVFYQLSYNESSSSQNYEDKRVIKIRLSKESHQVSMPIQRDDDQQKQRGVSQLTNTRRQVRQRTQNVYLGDKRRRETQIPTATYFKNNQKQLPNNIFKKENKQK